MRLGLVGYGVGGRYFHAPFIAAAQDVELAGVVTRSPDRRAELAADLPGVPAYDSLADLLTAGVDAVTITTPPQTRRALVLEAIAAGTPTIADKPFAPDAAGGRELVAAATEAGVPLNVFHNRRWDADIRTLAAVPRGGALGELWAVESRMDQADAATLAPTAAPGRTWPAARMCRRTRCSPGGGRSTRAASGATTRPSTGARSTPRPAPRRCPPSRAPTRTTTPVAAPLRGDGDFPVPAEQAVHTLEVLDAARVSDAENRVVDLPRN